MNYTLYSINSIDYISFAHNGNIENYPWFRQPPVSKVNLTLNK